MRRLAKRSFHSAKEEIRRRLKLIHPVKTPEIGVINDIVWPGPGNLVVRSHAPYAKGDREIQGRWILTPHYQGKHSCIVRALQQILGL